MFNKKNMDKLTKIRGTQSRTKGINLMKSQQEPEEEMKKITGYNRGNLQRVIENEVLKYWEV